MEKKVHSLPDMSLRTVYSFLVRFSFSIDLINLEEADGAGDLIARADKDVVDVIVALDDNVEDALFAV